MKNFLAVISAAAILATALVSSAAPSQVIPTETAKSCPVGSAIAQSAKVNADGSIVITTRCVSVSRTK